MKKYEKDFEDQNLPYFVGSMTYKLMMPGNILQPSDAVIHGDTLSWRLTAYRMIPSDYIITAQSRQANIWAFILTGMIMLAAVGSFFWKPGRRKL